MELRITSPQEGGFVKEIQWNHEELKAEIAAKMNEYKTLAFTEEQIKEMKNDRVNLRKLKDAFESERKRIKKLCMEPYDLFERQVKEITALIDEPIGIIDSQIKEIEENRKKEKMEEIQLLFDAVGFQPFVKLDMIFDKKWLNASVSLKKVDEALHEALYRIGEDVYTISQLPEFSFEAMETYKKTLNLTNAIQEGQRLADIQKRKMEHEEELRRQAAEAEQRRQAEEAARNDEEQHQETPEEVTGAPVSPAETVERPSEETVYTIDFRVTGTRDQLAKLKEFLSANRIQYAPVPKEGE